MAAEKEKKRKERLAELKVELHKRLLEDLNLAALETASEASLRPEIAVDHRRGAGRDVASP